ncbi:MAG: universal stress protein [Bacteroidia bacterium]
MGKILVGIDYGPACVAALHAALELRRILRDPLVLYHAYQLPKGLPFLSAHVIEAMEDEARKSAQKKLKEFLSKEIHPANRRGIKLITHQDFVTDGIYRYLATENCSLLAIGSQNENTEAGGSLGFHARHFIFQAPVPVLIAFPESRPTWQRPMVIYDRKFSSPLGRRFLRRLARRSQSEFIGLPLLRYEKLLHLLHRKLHNLLGKPEKYTPVMWKDELLIRLILQMALHYKSDVLIVLADKRKFVEGLQRIPPSDMKGQPAWVFFPALAQSEPASA